MAKVLREILIRYGEIFLKSGFVFRQFERKLIESIGKALKRKRIVFEIKKERGRIFLTTGKEALGVLGNIFGIVSFSPVEHLKTADLAEIKNFCKKRFKNFVKKGETFAVRAKRAGKHNFSSKDLENEIGGVIEGKVDLAAPDKKIFIEVRGNDAYIFNEIFQGLGGLPLSSSGKVISFISGGIDSAVSSFLAMKKGCQVVFLHFHGFPLVSKKSIDKTKEIVEKLNDYQFKSKLILVPFHKIQTYLKIKAPAKYLIVLYRRSMARIGEMIAKQEGAQAIFTGESLSQVSSQTLTNLATIDQAFATVPVFRPLISMDKEEIINIARKIGTYDISILPQEDCCQLFVPKHPSTEAKLGTIKEIERFVGIKKLEIKILKEKQEIFI